MKAAILCLATLALASVEPSSAAELETPREGWASWEVPAVDQAPHTCCFDHWDAKQRSTVACRLDAAHVNLYSGRNATTDKIRVYARLREGKVTRLRSLSADCPVKAESTIQDLGSVEADDSARWLALQVRSSGGDALAALALHRGSLARDRLADFARNEPHVETRKKAMFWLAQSGAAGAESIMAAAIRKDPEEEVREEAIFALSQLPDARSVNALIAVAEDQSLTRNQRKKAVFWLSQSDSKDAMDYLDKVLERSAAR